MPEHSSRTDAPPGGRENASLPRIKLGGDVNPAACTARTGDPPQALLRRRDSGQPQVDRQGRQIPVRTVDEQRMPVETEHRIIPPELSAGFGVISFGRGEGGGAAGEVDSALRTVFAGRVVRRKKKGSDALPCVTEQLLSQPVGRPGMSGDRDFADSSFPEARSARKARRRSRASKVRLPRRPGAVTTESRRNRRAG